MAKKKKGKPKKKDESLPFLATFGIGRERDYFIENLSVLVSSGMGVLAALDALASDTGLKRMRVIIAHVRKDIEAGSPLWRSLDYARLFPAHAVSLIKIGEESGKLLDNLRVVSLEQEKDRLFRSKIRSAMMYPMFVLTLTVIIGTGIAWFILPKLALVFSQLHLQLPLVTKILIGTGLYLGAHGTIVVPAVSGIFFAIVYFVFFFSKTKFLGQTMLFALPGIRRLIQEIELARFGYLLGTLLQAGLPIIQALESLSNATFFSQYKKFYSYLTASVEEGNSFQKSFAGYRALDRLIPVPVQQLIVTGEQSGHLSETLVKVSRAYETKTETTTKDLSVILEPVLLVIVWLGVVAVALAVILPIYNLVGSLNTGIRTPSTVSSSVKKQTSAPPPPPAEVVPPQASAAPVLKARTLAILPTETGFLNVRDRSSVGGAVVGRVLPGEIYASSKEENGWYEITLQDGKAGWVASRYIKLLSDETAP